MSKFGKVTEYQLFPRALLTFYISNMFPQGLHKEAFLHIFQIQKFNIYSWITIDIYYLAHFFFLCCILLCILVCILKFEFVLFVFVPAGSAV